MDTDENLVYEYTIKNNTKAFDELFERYVDSVYRFLYSRTENRQLAEDLTSQTFLILLDVLKNFSFKSKLSSFIIGISMNLLKQEFRKRKQRNETVWLEDVVDDLTEADLDSVEENKLSERKILLQKVLDKLPNIDRNILIDRFVNQYSLEELALRYQKSNGNIRVLIHRGLKKASKIAMKLQENENIN